MKLQRFYVKQNIEGEEEVSLTDSELINQLGKVFRFQPGDQIIIFNGTGFEYKAEIILINKKEVKLKILSHALKNSQVKNVSLYLSLIKKGNFELAAEKCTEVGVSEIHPIVSERSEKKDLNIERLNKIVKEASEQSGRTTLPAVFDITSLDKAVSQAIKAGKIGVVFDPSGVKPEKAVSQKEIAVFVGPEGGFTEKELDLFKKNNFQILSLGQNILRAETAAIVAVWGILN